MKNSFNLPVLVSSVFLLIPASRADEATPVPSCASHLLAPEPGKTMSAADLEANQSCLAFLETVSKAARLKAEIAAAGRQGTGRNSDPGTSPAYGSGLVSGAGTSSPAPGGELPKVSVILGGKAAILLTSSGSFEVRKGAVLPSGAIVTSITSDAITIRDGSGSHVLPMETAP